MRNLTEQYPTLAEACRVALFENFAEDLDEFGIFEPDRVNPISSEAYSGFIPFTNGGYDAMVMQFLNYHYNTTGREADIIAPYVESSENDAAAEFVRHRGEDTDGPGPELAKAYRDAELPEYGGKGSSNFVWNWFNEREEQYSDDTQADCVGDKPAFWSTPVGILREEFSQYSDEWLSEGGGYWLQARCVFFAADNSRNETGSDEIFFYAGVNTDFTYGRDKGLECTFERTYKVSRLTPARIRVIVKAMQSSLSESSQ